MRRHLVVMSPALLCPAQPSPAHSLESKDHPLTTTDRTLGYCVSVSMNTHQNLTRTDDADAVTPQAGRKILAKSLCSGVLRTHQKGKGRGAVPKERTLIPPATLHEIRICQYLRPSTTHNLHPPPSPRRLILSLLRRAPLPLISLHLPTRLLTPHDHFCALPSNSSLSTRKVPLSR